MLSASKLLIALAVAGSSITLLGGHAHACSCDGRSDVAAERDGSDYALLGRVVRSFAPGPRAVSAEDTTMLIWSNDMVRYEVATMALWNGAAADTLIVYSERESSSCGFPMAEGHSYLVFASYYTGTESQRSRDSVAWAGGKPDHPPLTVNACTNSCEADNSSEIVALMGPPEWIPRPLAPRE